ncbi:winged helix-turn-helix transcriptional regulator [Natrononativus amylolyticus]|uniref:winged helix-turn-helix transcriptional regulator n=1 Tax=Natrononativus amylolyticus TaxID=2963434 RepID=UPI0020CE33F5|nr:ArsR family transcriptional regulator [Natrononativus amylolyticus]
MSETRGRIRAAIASDPGVHFNALVRDLSLAPGQVQYHVRRLIDAGDVVRHERFGRTHYYPPTYDEWERDALAMVRRETTGAIVTALYSRGETRPGALAADLDLPRSTLEYHLSNLLACGVVERRRERGNRVVLSLCRPAETAALLEAVSADPGTRLVDRFERLVDSLLEER